MKKHGKLLLKYLLLFVMTVFVMGCFSVSAATKTGFVTQKGKTYYINKDGSKQKGWLELKGKKYYFDKKTGVQVKGSWDYLYKVIAQANQSLDKLKEILENNPENISVHCLVHK